MKINFILDGFDFDDTHQAHQVFENIGQEMGRVITDKLRHLVGFQDEHGQFGGTIEIHASIHGPDLNKADTAQYNKEYDYYFDVQDADHIVVVPKKKGGTNPDNITKTEKTYLQEMIDGTSNKIIADDHDKNIETVKSNKKSIRFKTKCKTPGDLKKYVDKHKLLLKE